VVGACLCTSVFETLTFEAFRATVLSFDICVRQYGQASYGSNEIPMLTVLRGVVKILRHLSFGQMNPFGFSCVWDITKPPEESKGSAGL
jgi:hypothetical protein